MDPTRYFKSLAKQLLKEFQAGDVRAIQRIKLHFRKLAKFSLQPAQHVIAREAGFDCWSAFLKARPIEQRFSLALSREPGLCIRGISEVIPVETGVRTRQSEAIAEQRCQLRKCVDDIRWTVDWLNHASDPIDSIDWPCSSDKLKHIAETHDPTRRICSGIIIAAGMIVGLEYQHDAGSPSVLFSPGGRRISSPH